MLVKGKRMVQPLLLVGGPMEFGENHVVHNRDEFVLTCRDSIQRNHWCYRRDWKQSPYQYKLFTAARSRFIVLDNSAI